MSIEVRNLEAGYGLKPILRDVSMRVEEGKICALLGRNGSGKTTLLRCLNALIKPAQGQVYLQGRDIAHLSRAEIARIVSVVPQSTSAPFNYPCLEVVLMGEAARLNPWSVPGEVARQRAKGVFKQIGIEHLLDQDYNGISGGEQQLVLLARALFQDTPYMLLDEPNSHLDFSNQHQMMSLMRQLAKQQGITMLITLHDPNLAVYYCDEIVLMQQGRLVCQGPTLEVLTDINLSAIYGNNIQTDHTSRGMQVVVPKAVVMGAVKQTLVC